MNFCRNIITIDCLWKVSSFIISLIEGLSVGSDFNNRCTNCERLGEYIFGISSNSPFKILLF